MSETFGQALRRLRRAAGLSQPALARQVHVDQASLSRYENDRQRAAQSTVECLDEAFQAAGELRRLATGSTAADALNSDDRERLGRVLERPHKLDGGTVSALAGALAAQRRLEESGQHPAPGTAYWLSPTFHRLNLGLAHLSLASYDIAADHLNNGLGGLPEDQQNAAWTTEYRDALAEATAAR